MYAKRIGIGRAAALGALALVASMSAQAADAAKSTKDCEVYLDDKGAGLNGCYTRFKIEGRYLEFVHGCNSTDGPDWGKVTREGKAACLKGETEQFIKSFRK